MPQRNSVKRIKTEELQGEDSWVEILPMKVGTIKEIRQRAKDEGQDDLELGIEVIQRHVKAWNWVDDDGNPLPQPSVGVDVFDSLTNAEIFFLREQILGSKEDLKK